MLLGFLLPHAFGCAGQAVVVCAGSERAQTPCGGVSRVADVLDGGGALERDGDCIGSAGAGKVLLGVGKGGVH